MAPAGGGAPAGGEAPAGLGRGLAWLQVAPLFWVAQRERERLGRERRERERRERERRESVGFCERERERKRERDL